MRRDLKTVPERPETHLLYRIVGALEGLDSADVAVGIPLLVLELVADDTPIVTDGYRHDNVAATLYGY